MRHRTIARIRTGVTLLVLLALVGGAVLWGWQSLTKELPSATAPPCTDIELTRGDKVYPDQVIVSVLNAGNRSGLASRTMRALTERGFVQGDLANAPGGTRVRGVQIWTDDPTSPAVRLLRLHLGEQRTRVVRRDVDAEGLNVVVGDRFDDLRRNKRQITVRRAATLCSAAPTGTDSESP